MANHVVRANGRGDLVVISRTPVGVRVSVPFTLPAQAIDRCRRECEADREIEYQASLQQLVDDHIDDLWFEHFAGHGGI